MYRSLFCLIYCTLFSLLQRSSSFQSHRFLPSPLKQGIQKSRLSAGPQQFWYVPEEDETEGFEPGDRVKVLKEVKLWHVNGFRDEGIDVAGLEGKIVNIWLRSRKNMKEVTVNLPLVVEFEEPAKFKAHFNFDEVEKL